MSCKMEGEILRNKIVSERCGKKQHWSRKKTQKKALSHLIYTYIATVLSHHEWIMLDLFIYFLHSHGKHASGNTELNSELNYFTWNNKASEIRAA